MNKLFFVAVIAIVAIVFADGNACTNNPLHGLNFTLSSDINADVNSSLPKTLEIGFTNFLDAPATQDAEYLCPDLKGKESCCNATQYDELEEQFVDFKDFIKELKTETITLTEEAKKAIPEFKKQMDEAMAAIEAMGMDVGIFKALINIMPAMVETMIDFLPKAIDAMSGCLTASSEYLAGFICLACSAEAETYIDRTSGIQYVINESAVDSMVDSCSKAMIDVPLEFAEDLVKMMSDALDGVAAAAGMPIDPEQIKQAFQSVVDELKDSGILDTIKTAMKNSLNGPDISYFFGEDGALSMVEDMVDSLRQMAAYNQQQNAVPMAIQKSPVNVQGSSTSNKYTTEGGYEPVKAGKSSKLDTTVNESYKKDGDDGSNMLVYVIVGVLVVAAIGAGAYFFMNKKQSRTSTYV